MKIKHILIAATLSLSTITAHAGPSVILAPSKTDVTIGENFSVEISIAGLESEDLGGFDFDLNFDSSLVNYNSTLFGSDIGSIDPLFPQEAYLIGDGVLNQVGLTVDKELSAQADSFVISTVDFTAAAVGTAFFDLDNTTFSDGLYSLLELVDSNFSTANVVIREGATQVPVPAGIALVAAGLLGLRASRKKA